jgi:hypothetical protein
MKQSLDMDEFPYELTHCNGLYVGHWQESIEGSNYRAGSIVRLPVEEPLQSSNCGEVICISATMDRLCQRW